MRRFSPTIFRTTVRNPKWAIDFLTLRKRLARELGVSPAQLSGWYHDLIQTDKLPSLLDARWHSVSGLSLSGYRSGATIGPQNEVLYILVRALQPTEVVETGVSYGFSTAYILQGLTDNGQGVLHSIDLPNLDPSGYVNADGVRDESHVLKSADVGSVIPVPLRSRWELTIGPSSTMLGPLLERVGQIEMFFHDSEHSFANMTSEFKLAWSRLRGGGYLVSDDVTHNAAFDTFCSEVGGKPFKWLTRGAVRRMNIDGEIRAGTVRRFAQR